MVFKMQLALCVGCLYMAAGVRMNAEKPRRHEKAEMKERGNVPPGGSVSVLETCPLKKFKDSYDWILKSKLLSERVRKESKASRAKAISAYLEIAEQRQCEVGPQWFKSEKPMIFNVGEGSTGTSFVHKVMKDLGFKTQHYTDFRLWSTGQWFTESMLYNSTVVGTLYYDTQADYFSDTPMNALPWQLLQSHPKALFLMTMRDPKEWFESRMKYQSVPADENAMAVPCGQYNPHMSTQLTTSDYTKVPLLYLVNAAWAKCILPEDRFLPTNLFSNETADADKDFVDKLIPLLEKHGLQKPNWEEKVKAVREKYLSPTRAKVNAGSHQGLGEKLRNGELDAYVKDLE